MHLNEISKVNINKYVFEKLPDFYDLYSKDINKDNQYYIMARLYDYYMETNSSKKEYILSMLESILSLEKPYFVELISFGFLEVLGEECIRDILDSNKYILLKGNLKKVVDFWEQKNN